ncbi:MAG: gamma-glutamylcyclotransferase family protein [Candidatus Natronoplasma sp.]
MAGTTRYFAYGSNLDLEQMEERGITVKRSELAELPGWRLAFTIYSSGWSGGVADIIPGGSDEKVEGVVYTILKEDLNKLDHYEGREVKDNMEVGMYRRQYIPVRTAEGRETVLTYVVNRASDYKEKVELKPSKEYMAAIISGAQEHGLSDDYIKRLEHIEVRG